MMQPQTTDEFKSSRSGRMNYIDAVKGVGILCITLLHFEAGIFPSWLNNWIGLFMVAAFYFVPGWISGVRGDSCTAKELFRKRLRQLGVPYLWFSLLLLAVDLVFCVCGWFEFKIFFRDLYKTLVLRGIGTLWFLPVLLFGETLFCAVRSAKQPWITGLLLLAVSLTAGYFYNRYLPLREKGDIYKVVEAPVRQIVYCLGAWQIVAVGYFAGKYGEKYLHRISKTGLCFLGIAVIGFSIGLMWCPDIYFVSGILHQSLPEFGFLCLFFAFPGMRLSRFCEYWGRNSLILMCLHYTIFLELCKIIHTYAFHQTEFTGWPTFIYFALSLLAIWPCVPFFKTKLRFMLGKS